MLTLSTDVLPWCTTFIEYKYPSPLPTAIINPGTLVYVTNGQPTSTPPSTSTAIHPRRHYISQITNVMMDSPLFHASITPTTDAKEKMKPTFTIRPTADITLALSPTGLFYLRAPPAHNVLDTNLTTSTATRPNLRPRLCR